jgi:putative phosphoribosyl transferase
MDNEIHIPIDGEMLGGNFAVPRNPRLLVLFAHGSGSSRYSPRNQYVANTLNKAGLATLLFDLLTPLEEAVDVHTRHHRFDIELLAKRLRCVTNWARDQDELGALGVGYFGSSTGGGAALAAAADLPSEVRAIVSRGGRPDLAGAALPKVQSPTLFIIGENDDEVIKLNQQAMKLMRCDARLEIVPGATHLFEEPGALETVARLAADWFLRAADSEKSKENRDLPAHIPET